MSNPNSPLLFDRQKALDIANSVVDTIKEYCNEIIVCGGIRRGIPEVHDVDIVAYPDDHFSVSIALGNTFPKLKSSKTRYEMKLEDMKVEVYVAMTERQYEVLKLVRTGSYGFITNLTKSANDKQMTLRYSYKEGLCGLYGGAWAYDKIEGRKKFFVNPMRKVAYKENDIIMAVLGEEMYLDPKSRNIGYEQDYENDL